MTGNHYLVPMQKEGSEKDIADSYVADSILAAEDLFVDAKERLLDVNNWGRYGGIGNVSFAIADSHGNTVGRRARKGDHIRIEAGTGGFHWAAIEALEYDDYPDINMETFALRARLCASPLPKPETAHAFVHGQEATSTFVIGRIGIKLYATCHGRNETADWDYEGEGIAPIAWPALTDEQCMSLIKGFIK